VTEGKEENSKNEYPYFLFVGIVQIAALIASLYENTGLISEDFGTWQRNI
jgi:hypothetical protein